MSKINRTEFFQSTSYYLCNFTSTQANPDPQPSSSTNCLTAANTSLFHALENLPGQEKLQECLLTILDSPWRKDNKKEPEGVFLPFIIALGQHQYRCIFCNDGDNTRMDRAIAHCRKHLDYRPFSCSGIACRDKPQGW